jgi:cytochrome P450
MSIHTLRGRVAPGPRGLELLKNVTGFYRDPLVMFAGIASRYGDVARLELGRYCFHLITRLEDLKHILEDNLDNYPKAGAYEHTRPVLGLGLATNSTPTWRRQRRWVEAAFHHTQIEKFVSTITTAVADMLGEWQAFAHSGATVNVWSELLQLNLRILGQVLFGVELGRAQAPIPQALRTVRDITAGRINALLTIPDSIPTPNNRRFQKAVAELDAFVYRLIDDRRREPGQDVVSTLICARDGETDEAMTDVQIHDEALSLLFSGYEDPANALTWALYLLAQSPDVEARLRSELQTVLQRKPPTLDDLPRLPYLTMALQETMRLYPPSWGILRDVAADDEVGGYHLPAGSSVFLPTYLIHRQPSLWPDPDAFDPTRFAPDNSAGRPDYAYFPFGGGPRRCLAEDFAMLEMQIVLAMILQAYRFHLVSDQRIEAEALHSLRLRRGLLLTLRPA